MSYQSSARESQRVGSLDNPTNIDEMAEPIPKQKHPIHGLTVNTSEAQKYTNSRRMDTGYIENDSKERDEERYEPTEKTAILTNTDHHAKWFNVYIATLPLAFIFLFDILPSRVSLIFIRYLVNGHDYSQYPSSVDTPITNDNVDSLYAFDSMFAAYGFTNFFVVFILSLSCGLDTLSKVELSYVHPCTKVFCFLFVSCFLF